MRIPIRHEKKSGFVDAAGQVVVPPVYAMLGDFHGEHVSCARTFDDPFGVLDRDGRVTVSPRFASIGEFHRGIAPATERWGEPGGYIDGSGEWAIAPCAKLPCPFDGDRALAQDAEGRVGLLDRDGRWAVAPTYTKSAWWIGFGTGGFAVKDAKKWGVIGPDGDVWVPMKFVELGAGGVVEGKPRVAFRRGKTWGYLDARTGKTLVKNQFETARPYDADGLATVKHGGRYGIIDAAGAWVAEPDYDSLGQATTPAGRRAFARGGRVGILGPEGVELELQGERASLHEHEGTWRLLVDGHRLFDDAGVLVRSLDLAALAKSAPEVSETERLHVDHDALGVYLRAGLAAIRRDSGPPDIALLEAIPRTMAPPVKALLIALAHKPYFRMSSFEIDRRNIRIHDTRVVLGRVADLRIHVEYDTWRNDVFTTLHHDEGADTRNHGSLDSFFRAAWKWQLDRHEPADPTQPESHVAFAEALAALGGE